ncbi:tyrosine-protein kinase CSK-like isoform X1 [Crassostrea virginica]|uniref:Tyrosine-protein kinase n=1 Tax=Crassostrea virginica TaxID=6565 RepID=A0A8B8DS86_CRAVI|nr:tyrosine-protein kinase CSK-like isoform X1 [Crassostrea virginica]XP_022330714.1 tyrosine-protein kinase CSK-like isoform X1 [Crassostrea virginica]XP_022330715.1 tyrosine-protein kinase CSK-like isoform X1 [Crassostrea virginica]
MTMPMDQNHQHQEKWSNGTQVVANYNFEGSNPDDLPFKKGDVITIVQSTRDPNWYKGQNEHGQEGMFPATYVQKRREVHLQAMPWYHGKISREEAEALLNDFREEGDFLIRDSVHFQGDYTLSIYFEGMVDHYRIIAKHNKLEVDGGDCLFDNLIQLVEHYQNDADGLCTKLIRALPKKGDSFGAVRIQDFEAGGWVIQKKDLQEIELIGRGEFGDVYKGLYKNQFVAVKQLKDQDRAAQAFLKEASVMTSLRHPNLVQLIGVVLGDTIRLVTEFMGKGNLVEYLRSRGRSVIQKKDQIDFATDTCAAMEYLESKKLVHRDLAARNILINENNTAKVSDFGLAKYGDYSTEGGKFPIKWTAPEALKNNKFSNKSDMWSYGILLWELYSFGRVPYPRIPLADVVMHVEKGYRMEAPEGCPKQIYNLMLKAWNLNPADRPTFKEALAELQNLRSTTV